VETVFNGTIDALAAVMQSMVNADQWVLGDQKAEHLARYKREINAKGRRVILVPHSQGNLYANEEYATLSENERTDMRIVATSTPSSFVPGDGPYTSVKEDKLASTIFAFTGALPTNLLNGTTQCSGSLADVNRWTCHGFKEEYLADGKPSRAKIVQDIILALPTAPTGLVTIVSNGSDFVLERNRNAVLVPYVHSAWTATEYIAGASWIWTTASPDPISDETATFQKKFEWNGTITKASLQIAADNSYSVSLNGILVAEDQSEGNYSASTWDEYDIAFAVQNGENVLRITVHNRGIGGEDNPAGLLYRVEVK
jgi:hypothetical protein